MKVLKKLIFLSLPLIFLLSANTASLSATENSPSVWNQTVLSQQEEQWITLPEPATAFSVSLPHDVTVSVQTEGSPEWKLVSSESDAHDGEEEHLPEVPDFALGKAEWSELVFAEKSFTRFRFRITAEHEEAVPTTVQFSFIDSRKGNSYQTAALGSLSSDSGLRIISRAEWGADESLRFVDGIAENATTSKDPETSSLSKSIAKGCDDLQDFYPDEFELKGVIHRESGKELIWPLQYSEKIEKFVIHHTAGATHLERNPVEVMRGIYSYHSRSRGWGDIGYHYVIDGNGNIYEGKAGGDYVVGGHVYCSNIQTIGIALMGNFQESDPTEGQINALQRLLPYLAGKYELDPSDSSVFHGKKLPNVLGHRDLGATACPGENMYALLNTVRKLITGSSIVQRLSNIDRSADFLGTVSVLKLKPSENTQLTFQFKNTGNVSWNSNTWLYVVQPKTGVSVISKRTGKKYVAALLKESNVKPGEVGTFTVDAEAGFRGGLYSLEFSPVVDGRKVSDAAVVQPVEVTSPDWGASLVNTRTEPPVPFAGERVSLSVNVKNTGTTRWEKDHITLHLSSFGKQYDATLNEAVILPGQTGSFSLSLPPFPAKRIYILRSQLLVDGRKMQGIRPFIIRLSVSEPQYTAQVLGNQFMRITPDANNTVNESIKIMNTGNSIWNKADTKLTLTSRTKKHEFTMNESSVGPREVATFSITFPVESTGIIRYVPKLLNGSRNIYGLQSVRFVIFRRALPTRPVVTPSTVTSPTPNAPSSVSNTNTIRVRLGYSAESATISSSGTFRVISDGTATGTVQSGDQVRIEKNETQVRLNSQNSGIIRLVPEQNGNVFTISSWNRSPAWDTNSRYNDNRFRGILELRVYNGEFIVVNELPLEEYLLGLAETGSQTHSEKHKVMSILARSYAAFYMQPQNTKFPGAPYDGDDSPERFQKYLGYSYEVRNPQFTAAAKATTGLVVKYGGKLVKTPYFSQSDGRTKSAEEVWGWTDTPYLQSVDDPFCAGMEPRGHGVGLSGCGAEAAAQRGKTYEEIIKYYYQGVTIDKL